MNNFTQRQLDRKADQQDAEINARRNGIAKAPQTPLTSATQMLDIALNLQNSNNHIGQSNEWRMSEASSLILHS